MVATHPGVEALGAREDLAEALKKIQKQFFDEASKTSSPTVKEVGVGPARWPWEKDGNLKIEKWKRRDKRVFFY